MKSKFRRKVLLTVDIGNTNINFSVFGGKRILCSFKIATKGNLSQFDLIDFRRRLSEKGISPELIQDVIVCSVVPKATAALKKALQIFLKRKLLIAGKNFRVPILNLYKTPAKVGQDRLVAAFAASEIYGFPIIVVDFGTAITLDVVSRKGAYLGGIILSGIGMSLEALHKKTALLPKVKPGKPAKVIGRDTKESILSGLYFGSASLIDGLIVKIDRQLSRKCLVVFTGGFAREIGSYSHTKKVIDFDLISKGLQLTYNQLLR